MSTQWKITDAGVAGLPIHEGRAELLEAIMATTPLETVPPRAGDPGPHRRRWLPVTGAAAAVAIIAAGAIWIGNQQEAEKEQAPAVSSASGEGEIAVLPVDGWNLTYASIDEERGGEISYEATDQSIDATPDNDWGVTLDIHWRPADLYQDYLEDREHITEPPSPGEKVEVLGVPGRLFTYSGDDHTVIREVVGDFTLEVRGSGMDEPAFRELLGQLEGIDPADLDSHLPPQFITAGDRPAVIAEMLEPIPLPQGFDTAIESEEVDRYQLGADVTSAVTCAWIDQFKAGDAAARQEAQDALATARDWPVLQEMDKQGGFSGVLWEIADEVVRGKVPREYEEGIGCS